MVEAATLAERYRLQDRIASGGMGSVYGAVDERLGRRVAVKLLRAELAEDDRFVERFRREARAAAALAHPNIASVFDYGEDDGRRFIVMELVDGGEDLARLLAREGALAPARAAAICAQMCDALAHAHQRGVIHRDVKPANVIVGEDDHVKVTDFGIARAAGDSTLTATGTVLGTAQYISPEQASGKPVTARSDIYAAGVVLYEMLAGEPPFTGDTPVAIALRHMSEDVPRPGSTNPAVPRALDDVVARATARDPERRFASAAEMAAALRAATGAGERGTAPLVVGPPTRPLGAETWPLPVAPRRAARLALVALALLAAAALALAALRALGARPGGEGRAAGTPNGRQQQATAAGSPSPTSGAPTFRITEAILGMKAKDAKERLEELGFSVEEVKVEDDAPKDTVVGTDPPIGSEVQPGQMITLYVSEGDKGPAHGPPGRDKHEEGDD